MGVLIKKMELPESCFMCELMHKSDDGEYMKCPLVGFKCSHVDFYGYFAKFRQAQCPLESVAVPHGRLIDADALDKEEIVFSKLHIERDEEGLLKGWRELLPLSIAPTIIPAEESEE